MSIFLIAFLLIFIAWTLWYIPAMNRVFNVHLKHLFEADVNEMAQFELGARYDAINLKENKWKIILSGLFIAPVRICMLLPLMTCSMLFSHIMMKVFGRKNYSCLALILTVNFDSNF